MSGTSLKLSAFGAAFIALFPILEPLAAPAPAPALAFAFAKIGFGASTGGFHLGMFAPPKALENPASPPAPAGTGSLLLANSLNLSPASSGILANSFNFPLASLGSFAIFPAARLDISGSF